MNWLPLTPETYAIYIAAYPQFTSISLATRQDNYNETQLFAQPLIGLIANQNANIQQTFVNKALSHVNQIYLTGLAGRLTSATTATISGNIEWDNDDEMAAYWNRTVYGQSVWNIAQLSRQLNGTARIAVSNRCYRRYYQMG